MSVCSPSDSTGRARSGRVKSSRFPVLGCACARLQCRLWADLTQPEARRSSLVAGRPARTRPAYVAAALCASTATAVLRAAVLDGAGVPDRRSRRAKGAGFRSAAISTASPRRQGAVAANSIACRRRRAGSRNYLTTPAHICKRLARSPCASRSSPAACSPAGSTSPSAPGSTLPSSWLLQACCAK